VVDDGGVEERPQPVHQIGEHLRVEALRQRGEATDVGEQHGHLPPALLVLRELHPQRRDCGVDHVVGYRTAQ
jgi:hypothetical protein